MSKAKDKADEYIHREYSKETFNESRHAFFAYQEGYNQAIKDASEWLKSKGGFTIGFDGATIKDFEESMRE